jgi:SAM-dependent methyltransferase
MSDYRKDSRAHWGESAKAWDAHSEQLRAVTLPVSAWMVEAIGPQPGDTILELAAGPGETGFLAAELIRPGGTLISSDLVPEMLNVAQRRAEQLGLDNVRFKQIDADTPIDIEAASIDGVLCRWGYMLMADPDHALRETRRILKPGGRVALAAWSGPDDNPWSSIPGRELVKRGLAPKPDPGAPGQFAWAKEGVIAEYLENAGFVEHRVELIDLTELYDDFEDYWNTMAEMSGAMRTGLASADAQTVDAIRSAVDQQVRRYTRDDGSLAIPARTWAAVAEA